MKNELYKDIVTLDLGSVNITENINMKIIT